MNFTNTKDCLARIEFQDSDMDGQLGLVLCSCILTPIQDLTLFNANIPLMHKFFGTRLVQASLRGRNACIWYNIILENGQCTQAAKQYKKNHS
jgi:hypothetical protein